MSGRRRPAELKQTHRLYPSLPSTNRYELCLPLGSAAEFPNLPECASQSEEPPGDNQSLKAHILILEEQNKELLSINTKWAKEYRTMVQCYQKKIRSLNESRRGGASEEEESDEEERRVTLQNEAKTKEAEAQTEAEKLRAENRRLARRGQHQQEEIRRLNQALEEALLTAQPAEGSAETHQDVWKHQAEVYKEDFLKERRDREKLKGSYLELERRFRKVQSELRHLKPQATPAQPPHCCACRWKNSQPDWAVQPGERQVQSERRPNNKP